MPAPPTARFSLPRAETLEAERIRGELLGQGLADDSAKAVLASALKGLTQTQRARHQCSSFQEAARVDLLNRVQEELAKAETKRDVVAAVPQAAAVPPPCTSKDLPIPAPKARSSQATRRPASRSRSRNPKQDAKRLRRERAAAQESWDELNAVSNYENLQAFFAATQLRTVNEKKTTKTGWLSRSFAYPLHIAVESCDVAAVKALIWAGVDQTLVDSRGLTALSLAKILDSAGSHREVIQNLLA